MNEKYLLQILASISIGWILSGPFLHFLLSGFSLPRHRMFQIGHNAITTQKYAEVGLTSKHIGMKSVSRQRHADIGTTSAYRHAKRFEVVKSRAAVVISVAAYGRRPDISPTSAYHHANPLDVGRSRGADGTSVVAWRRRHVVGRPQYDASIVAAARRR